MYTNNNNRQKILGTMPGKALEKTPDKI